MDALLYDCMRERLVEVAQKRGVELRQTYCREGKKALRKQGGYSHAQQYKRVRKETCILKTYLGRVARDIERKAWTIDDESRNLLGLAYRLLAQVKRDKKKLYLVHEPDVECISKGKIHKRYGFGCKVGIATTARKNWAVGPVAFHENMYDGHTLRQTIDQVERITGATPVQAG